MLSHIAYFVVVIDRPGWPPEEFSDRAIHDHRFNSLYYMNDATGNYRMFRWIDNNVVKMVSNVHLGTSVDEAVSRARKKPRINEFNRKNIRLVWGDDHTANVKIPSIVNDYNHWMLGVDVVDQLIAYYRPKIRCRRTWMPIFLQCLCVLRVNSYVLYKETSRDHPEVDDKEIKSHKSFLIEFINVLIRRAIAETTTTRTTVPSAATSTRSTPTDSPIIHKDKTGNLRYCRTKPSLCIFDHLRYLPGKHKLVVGRQQKCKYCQYLVLLAKNNKQAPPIEARPYKQCNICKLSLCDKHFDQFHE